MSASTSTNVPTVIGIYDATAARINWTNTTTIPINAWNHIALSRNGSNWAVWLNGTRVGTLSSSQNFVAGDILIGGASASSYAGNFNGYISNLRIVKNTYIYDPNASNIVVPSSPLQAVQSATPTQSAITGTQTMLLACHAATLIDGSTNSYTITNYNTTTVSTAIVPTFTNVSLTSYPPPTTIGNIPFTTDGTTWSSTQKIVQGTSVTLTNQTSVDFTSIPSWVKRITVTFNGLSTNGSSPIIIQLGSTTFTTSGYLGGAAGVGTSTSSAINFTSGLPLASSGAAPDIRHGSTIISNLTGNIWTNFTALSLSNTNYCNFGGGSVTLSGVLDRVRITTVNGTDTFDAGNINILYE